MTEEELCTLLKTLGFPVAYSAFNKPATLPFITYQFSGSADLMADNKNHAPISNYVVELYAKKKDLVSETDVENLLKSNNLPFVKREFFIDSEKILQIIYEIQLIGG